MITLAKSCPFPTSPIPLIGRIVSARAKAGHPVFTHDIKKTLDSLRAWRHDLYPRGGAFERRSVPTQQDIIEALKGVTDPELHKDIVALQMVQDVEVHDGDVSFTLNLTTPACPLRTRIEEGARNAVSSIPGVKSVKMKTTASVVATRPYEEADVLNGVKNVIAVASGKGGVGKSTIAVNLALGLSSAGARVGLLDADIYGPNIPLMMGVKEKPTLSGELINPPVAHGVKVVSLGFFYKDETPLIWRGPMVAGAVKQLITKVNWGQLDYLVVDLPPGCLPAGTPVLMANNAPRPIEQVKVGDFVMSYDGHGLVPKRVLGVIPQGRQHVFELKTPNRTILASGNHPFLKYHRKEFWKRLDGLRVRDRLLVTNYIDGDRPLTLPQIESSPDHIELPSKTTPDFMRIVGHFVGDGFVKIHKGRQAPVGIRICEPRDSKFRRSYEELYKGFFNCHIFEDDGGQKFAIASPPLTKLFAALDLDHKAREKRVPDWVFGLPVDQRLAFLRGYAEAYGHIRHLNQTRDLPDASGRVRTIRSVQDLVATTSTNKRLVNGIHFLCQISGIPTTNIRERVREGNVLPGGRMIGPSTQYEFEYSLKPEQRQFKIARIKSIRPGGERETYDLQVEQYQNFIANGFIVHNTGDSALTLAQTVPLGGIVIVTTPQEASVTIAQKALQMFKKLDVPILGVVENMSYFDCPHCGERTYIFSTGGGRRISSMLDVDFLGELPLDPAIREGMDKGLPIVVSSPDSPQAMAFKDLAFRVAGMVSIIAFSKASK
jgi:Mrp family chromosome partitioning ATPase